MNLCRNGHKDQEAMLLASNEITAPPSPESQRPDSTLPSPPDAGLSMVVTGTSSPLDETARVQHIHLETSGYDESLFIEPTTGGVEIENSSYRDDAPEIQDFHAEGRIQLLLDTIGEVEKVLADDWMDASTESCSEIAYDGERESWERFEWGERFARVDIFRHFGRGNTAAKAQHKIE